MGYKFNELKRRRLRRTALAVACACFAGGVLPAYAADEGPKPSEPTRLEGVSVVGSRIKRADIETSQPVFTIERADIEKQGFATVEDIINHLTSAGTASVNRSTVLVSNTYGGGSFVDMRNLGVVRTLILVDGRRWATDVNGRTDLATIPASIIERIEVLKDGASAIYGSDAIAGVVNIVTRKQFDGVLASGYWGQYDQGDGTDQTYGLTMGNTTDKTSLIFDASYQKIDPVWARDRKFSQYPFGQFHPTIGLSPVGPGGVLVNGPTGGGGASGRQWKLNPGGDPTNFADYHPFGDADYYNTNVQQMEQIGSERKAIFTKARYDFTPSIALRADALYDERVSTTQIAGYPFQGNSFGIVIDKDSYYNPLGSQHGYATPQSLQFTRRITDVPRLTDNNLKTYHFGTGLEGVFDLAERQFNWDVNYAYNKLDGVKHIIGNLNLINVRQALGPSFLDADGKIKCGTPGKAIAGCVPWNVLAGQGQYGADVLNYVLADIQDTYSATTTDYSANLSGEIFQLPAGALAFAAGYESRHESGYFRPDALSSTGNTTNNAAQPTKGKYSVDEFYVELSVPVLKDLAFAKSLDLSVAGRRSDYSNFGSTTNGKFGLTWRPIDDLLARGSYSEGFRAPTINDLFGGTSQTFDQYLDPCDSKYGLASTDSGVAAACAKAGLPAGFRQTDAAGNPIKSGGGAQSTTAFLSGSNPNLKPETSTSKTLGLVYSPSHFEGFDVSLDWYRIRIQNLISGISSTTILNNCYRGNTAYCGLFQRNPATGQVINLNRSLLNTGWVQTEGYDLSLNYKLPKTDFGTFKLSIDTNYVAHYSEQANPTAKVIQDNGFYPQWRVRSNLGLDWNYADWGATWGLRYYGSFKATCRFDQTGGPECSLPNFVSPGTGKQPMDRIGAIAFNDVQVRYHLPWNATASIGANNVFDRVGPYVYQANGSFSQYSYHPAYDVGRFWYVKYQQKF